MTTSLWQLLGEYKVEIPVVQRDYAQGRQLGKAPVIREKFLIALHAGMQNDVAPLELDFVYGYIKKDEHAKSFIPLDGQQRLTTLFLLHWFIAIKEKRLAEAKDRLIKFTYQTRHSSRLFCNELINFVPDELDTPIKKAITDQPWFFAAWVNDATINAMLTMLNAIQEKFMNLDNGWAMLTSDKPRIVFHLLPMDNLGLPDELYIKMNSRGKELTDFEHFKSRFSEILDTKHAAIFNNKIDQEWSDLFWDLYKNESGTDIAKQADNAFLRYFHFITDFIIYKTNIEINDNCKEFERIRIVYNEQENVDYLFSCLNIFSKTYLSNPNYFDSVFYINYNEFGENKVRLFFQNTAIDLFKKCVDCYDSNSRINPFSIGEQLLLYACTIHLLHQTVDFEIRIRKLRNLISNSEDAIRKENLASLIFTVSHIIQFNTIDGNSKFNKTQSSEEDEKEIFLSQSTLLRETLNRLEDHQLLQGCVAIFHLNPDFEQHAKMFQKVFLDEFNCDLISKALLTFGDYSQRFGNWFWQYGNTHRKHWRDLFTPSQRRSGFENTRELLRALFSRLLHNPEGNLEAIVSSHLMSYQNEPNRPKDWLYYFIKYPEFRKNEDGFYSWPECPIKPYERRMMRRSTLGGFYWSPFLYTLKAKASIPLGLENYGAPLIFVKGNYTLSITNVNNGYKLSSSDDEGKALIRTMYDQHILDSGDTFLIQQNSEEIDTEDRILKGLELIDKIMEI